MPPPHDSPTFNIDAPVANRHELTGALVGGPRSADDFDYVDDRHARRSAMVVARPQLCLSNVLHIQPCPASSEAETLAVNCPADFDKAPISALKVSL